jgi:hypothetical protein
MLRQPAQPAGDEIVVSSAAAFADEMQRHHRGSRG